MAGRGQLTERIQQQAEFYLGRRINQTELRLMPYIHYTMLNEQRIDPNRINADERIILSAWRSSGWIEGGASGLSVAHHFWNAINEILWLGYVSYREEDSQTDGSVSPTGGSK